MRPTPRSSRLLALLALASLPLACGADHGSLGDLATDSGSGGESGSNDGNGSMSTTAPGCGAIQLADVAAGVGGFAIGGTTFWQCSGFSVSLAGDVNGDGLADMVVGSVACNGSRVERRNHVVFGKADTDRVSLEDVAQGVGGFALDGEEEWEYSSYSLSGAGDVNGDGLADVLVTAVVEDPDGLGSPRVYLVFGKADTSLVSLADVAQGAGGFIMDGEANSFGGAGVWVSGAGDVNGDGLADVVVGASKAAPNGIGSAGRTYVVFGKANTDPVSLADVAGGVGGFAIDGEAAEDNSGYSVSGASDVNGDGFADVLVGAPRADPNGSGSGRAYVVFGKVEAETVSLSEIAQGVGGFVVDGEAEGDGSGLSVSGVGDANGDGVPDIVVGALRADPQGVVDSGRTYVVFGKSETTPVSLEDVAQGIGGFAMDGEAEEDGSGRSVAGSGDVNGDGLADVIVGAPNASPSGRVEAGRTYVVYGKADADRISLADVAQGIGGFVLDGESGENEDDPGDDAGRSVNGAGDVNGDGVPDILVGAPWANPPGDETWDAGRTYVVFGGDFSCAEGGG